MEGDLAKAPVHNDVSTLKFLIQEWEDGYKRCPCVILVSCLCRGLQKANLEFRDIIEDVHGALLLKCFKVLSRAAFLAGLRRILRLLFLLLLVSHILFVSYIVLNEARVKVLTLFIAENYLFILDVGIDDDLLERARLHIFSGLGLLKIKWFVMSECYGLLRHNILTFFVHHDVGGARRASALASLVIGIG